MYSPAPMMSWGVVEKKRPNSQPPGCRVRVRVSVRVGVRVGVKGER